MTGVPQTVAGLLILLLGFLPGIPGEYAYRLVAGTKWTEKEYQHLLRLAFISACGLALYLIVAGWFSFLPPPEYLTIGGNAFQAGDQLARTGTAFLGHTVGALVAGLVGAGVAQGVARLNPGSFTRNSWDEFVNGPFASGHWVVVRTSGGDTYAGIMRRADVGVAPEHRDVLLEEPCRYDCDAGAYIADTKQALLIQGSQITSIATVHDPELDTRLTQPGEHVFPRMVEEERNE